MKIEFLPTDITGMAFLAALTAWEKTLPPQVVLDERAWNEEKGRVTVALLAYQRQLDAMRIIEAVGQDAEVAWP